MLLLFEFRYCSDLLLLFRIYFLRVNLVFFGNYTLFLHLLYSFGTHAQRVNWLISCGLMLFELPYCVAFWDLSTPCNPTFFLLGFMNSSYPAFSLGIMRYALLYCFFRFNRSIFFLWFMRCALPYCVLFGFNALRATVLFYFGIYALRATLLCSFVLLGFNALCATLLCSCVLLGFIALCATLLCSFEIYALSATLLFEPFPSRNLSSEFRILMFWAHN